MCFLERLFMCPSTFLGFFVSQGRELENECVMWNGFFFNGCALIPFFLCICIFFTSEVVYRCFGVLESQSLFYCLLWTWCSLITCLLGRTKKRNLVQGRGKITVWLKFAEREESSCKKGVTVTFPSWMGCCTCWCLNQCWDTASNIFCIGSGAKWAHFMKGLTEILFILTYSNRTNLKS